MEQSCDAVGLQMHPVKDVAPELGHSWREEKGLYNVTIPQHIKLMGYDPKQILNILAVRCCPKFDIACTIEKIMQ